MARDAMGQWRRELAEQRARFSQPPPRARDEGRGRRRIRAHSGGSLLALPAVLGAVLALGVLVESGWPPPLDPVSPAFALVPAVPAAAALATSRSAGRMASWAATACVTGFVTVFLVVPVWAIAKFLDCWLSWLSDC